MGLFSSKRERVATGDGQPQLAAERGGTSPSEPHYSEDYVSAHAPNWLEALKRLVGKPEALGLEIGAFEGRSTRWFLEHVLTGTRARLIVMDPSPRASFFANVEGTGNNVRPYLSGFLPIGL